MMQAKGKAPNPHRDLARLHKALALANVLAAGGVGAASARLIRADEWARLARELELRVPSAETVALVCELLRQREQAGREAGLCAACGTQAAVVDALCATDWLCLHCARCGQRFGAEDRPEEGEDGERWHPWECRPMQQQQYDGPAEPDIGF